MRLLPCIAASAVLLKFLTAPVPANEIDFERDIAPLLTSRCLECHRGDDAEAKLDLSKHSAVLTGGESGAALIPGDLEGSLIWQRVAADEMPEDKPLADEEKAVLRQWIKQGAKWGDGPINPFRISTDSRAGYDWWSLQDLHQPKLPAVQNKDWVRNPIDAFVLAKLESAGLSPSPQASDAKLLRRLYFDITGLPPSPEVMKQIDKASPDWYPLAVDQLLASPLHGQRWARHWLDVVRFGESHGFEYNQPRDVAWHYRNWVIDALNADMPYDQFVRWQIAGDAIKPNYYAALSATGFLVAGPHNTTKPSNKQMQMTMRHDELEDIVGTIGQTFLGLTVNCARCHDHKFDPVTQQEYYQLVATVVGIDHGEQYIPGPAGEAAKEAELALADIAKEVKSLEEEQTRFSELVHEKLGIEDPAKKTEETESPTEKQLVDNLSDEQYARRVAVQSQLATLNAKQEKLKEIEADKIYVAVSKTPPKVNRLRRGDVTSPAEPVVPAGIAAVNAELADFHLSETAPDQSRRLKLAQWLTRRGNPVFARVIANRLWHYHFGQGLVRTPSDFGFNGDRPSHPELLDYLAIQLIRFDWNLKPLHRMIVSSATYQQSSQPRPDAESIDADNRLLWRVNPRRLTAEEIRDSILWVAGKLDNRLGDAGYRDMKEYKYRGSHFYDPIEAIGSEAVRRTVYRFSPRGAKRTILDTFDCPDPSAKAPKRAVTITPLQALSLLNHHFVMDMAQQCALRVQNEASTTRSQIDRLFSLAYSRPADASELDQAEEFVNANTLADLCRVLLNSNEFLHAR